MRSTTYPNELVPDAPPGPRGHRPRDAARPQRSRQAALIRIPGEEPTPGTAGCAASGPCTGAPVEAAAQYARQAPPTRRGPDSSWLRNRVCPPQEPEHAEKPGPRNRPVPQPSRPALPIPDHAHSTNARRNDPGRNRKPHCHPAHTREPVRSVRESLHPSAPTEQPPGHTPTRPRPDRHEAPHARSAIRTAARETAQANPIPPHPEDSHADAQEGHCATGYPGA